MRFYTKSYLIIAASSLALSVVLFTQGGQVVAGYIFGNFVVCSWMGLSYLSEDLEKMIKGTE